MFPIVELFTVLYGMKNKKITFYVEENIAELIEQTAKAQNRTVSNFIASLIIPQLPKNKIK